MGRELSPAELHELLGVYALGALDDDERAQVEQMLLRDPSARSELHTLQLGVAWMDHASTRAPMHVWRGIEHEIAGERSDVRAPTAAVVPLRPRATRPARWLAVAAAIVAVLVMALGGLAVRGGSDGGSDTSVAAAAAAAARAPNAQTVALRSADGARAGRVVVADGRAYLVWSDPPPASVTGTYQLWALTPDGMRPAGLLGGAAHDHAFAISGTTSAVAVTLEPRGGSRAPTTAPVAAATIA